MQYAKCGKLVIVGDPYCRYLNAAPGLFFAVGGIVALVVIVWKGTDVDTSFKEPDGSEVNLAASVTVE